MVQIAPSLLIADDDEAFRETLRGALEHRGFRTLPAENGEEALSIIQSKPVHLLLLDQHMPKLTGIETLRRLKTIRVLLPCILLSAELDDSIIEEARRERAFEILSKSSALSRITTAVREALQQTYAWHS